MDNEEKLDKIMELVGDLKISMTDMKGTLVNHIANTDKDLSIIREDINKAADARKVIHQKQDLLDGRINKLELNPVFSEWSAIKGRLFSLLWGVLIVVGAGILLTALPKIIELAGK